MSDVFHRFQAHLRAAQVTSPAPARSALRRHRRKIVGAGIGAVIAGPAAALAVVAPWQPDLSRPDVDGPVATDTSAVSPDALSSFAALRRGQTAADRSGAEPLLRAVGMGNQVDRIQTDGIRLVAPGWAVVPAMAIEGAPGADAAAGQQLCLTDGTDVGCATSATAAANGVGILTASRTVTHLAGLVPDAVARVRFVPASGSPVETATTRGFFALTIPIGRQLPPVRTPAGYDGPATVPGPPAPAVGRVEWLDAGGRVIGPSEPTID